MRSRLARFAHDAALIAVGACLVGGTAVAADLIDGGDVKDGSLTGKDIKDKSLSIKDFKDAKGLQGATGPAGQAGAVGPTGPAGPPGSTGSSGVAETEEVAKSTPSDTEAAKELAVKCPNGPVLSGGYVIGVNDPGIRAVRSYAIASDEWLVRAVDDAPGGAWHLTVVAVCAK